MKSRRFFSILILSVMVFLNLMPVSAAANKRMIQKCVVNKNLIQLYTCMEDGEKEEYSAKLSDIELLAPTVESTEQDAVTWYVLLDISGSMRGTPFDCAKEVIRTISDNMTGGDNLVISTMGDIITPSPYMTDPVEIASYIEKLEVTHEDTNLYTGIVKSMEELLSNTRVNTKKCLIILSDGHNDQDKGSNDGSTEKEATSIVKEQTIPVFTIATLYENPSKEANEYAEILGSFARDSVGGRHYVPVVENISSSDIGRSIVKNMHKTKKLTFDLNQLSNDDLLRLEQKDRNTLTLRLSCLVDGEKRYEDTADLYRDDLEVRDVAAVPETTAETEPQTEAETKKQSEAQTKPAAQTESAVQAETESETEQVPEENGFLNTKTMTGLAAGAVVLIVLLVIVLRKKKTDGSISENGNNTDAGGNGENGGSATVGVNEEDSGNSNLDGNGENNDNNGMDGNGVDSTRVLDTPETNTAAAPPAYKMYIFVIGDSSLQYQYLFDANKAFTLGRDDRSDMILIKEDRKLSGQNCQLLYDGKQMYLKDISTNGTVVEGVKLIKNQPVVLKNDSKVRMGSYEYRLTWTRNE